MSIDIIDFNSCEPVFRFYGGRAGRKVSRLLDGEPWLIKFPESTRALHGGHLPSYTTSPLSEYIGSRIYQSLGIPVHEVVLGTLDGKIVAGCKDFAVDVPLTDFASIKNAVSEDVLESGSNSSDSRGELLADACTVIERAEVFEGIRDKVRARFWDMFVTDAFILNNDRNNGNWGIQVGRYAIELAPVFDNGNALFNKRNASAIERRLGTEGALGNDLDAATSFFQTADGRSIHPFAFMAENRIPDLDAAIGRFADSFDAAKVEAIIDGIPERFGDLDVASPAQKEFYKNLLMTAAKERILLIARAHGLGGRASAVPTEQTPSAVAAAAMAVAGKAGSREADARGRKLR